MSVSPRIVVLGGPNGAGKTTLAHLLLRDRLGIHEFVSVDMIALGLSAFDPDGAAIAARRVLLGRLRQLTIARAPFAFESAQASRPVASFLAAQRAKGFKIDLVLVGVRSAQLAVARVACRVRAGGYSVPSETVRRRYHRCIPNFVHLYVPFADTWRIYDNSDARPRSIAEGGHGSPTIVHNESAWWAIQAESFRYR